MPSLPLLPRSPDQQTIAYRQGVSISFSRFLRDILALAATLPAQRPILNLCNDRYLFAVSLFAAACRGNQSLLPNAHNSETFGALKQQHPELLCISDQTEAPQGLAHQAIYFDPRPCTAACPEIPHIPAEQIFVRVFTSGSTGAPQAHLKTFGKLWQNIQAAAARLWAITGGPASVLGTVPFQHMYGLESSVLLPLWSGGILSAERPFFPADIATALDQLPQPRFLVSTPFHLRKLLDAHIRLPPLAGVLSATAPLEKALAEQTETQLGAPMLEIYGSTETGQIATRQTTQTDLWQLLEGVRLDQTDDSSCASGGHIERPIVLGDILQVIDAQHFRLLGRHSDMINIAGKRSSLAFLNNVIQRQPGVQDAVFCLPHTGENARLAAFVVAPGLNARTLQSALRDWVDPVFLPRPIIFLDALPRNATGKIPADALAALIADHLKELP